MRLFDSHKYVDTFIGNLFTSLVGCDKPLVDTYLHMINNWSFTNESIVIIFKLKILENSYIFWVLR